MFPPEVVSMEQHSLETGQGKQLEVSCLVRGEPRPRVLWYRSG